ncbi:tyrosinase family protein, partial [Streptomyces sp. NPDC048279]|uniref:tyrosinase family protein n=1 Tax=Streptomyces sp. NPDC048279 TaxID=3154714 RepID=UPI003414C650
MAYVRKDVGRLTAGERKRLVDAFLEVKRRGEYDEFVRTRIDHYTAGGERGPSTAHMAPSFLPWHRRFLLERERALRRVDGSVTVPYWDWTKDRTASSVPWTRDLLGGNGRALDHQGGRHRRRVPDPGPGPGPRPDRAAHQGPARPGTGRPGVRRRPVGLDRQPGIPQQAGGLGAGSGSTPWRNHNRVHRWVGGAMLGGAFVNDPAFWLHHAFVDLQWERRQARHRGQRYLPAGAPRRGEKPPPWNVTPASLEDLSRIH